MGVGVGMGGDGRPPKYTLTLIRYRILADSGNHDFDSGFAYSHLTKHFLAIHLTPNQSSEEISSRATERKPSVGELQMCGNFLKVVFPTFCVPPKFDLTAEMLAMTTEKINMLNL